MAEKPTELHPALEYLKDNAIVISLVLIFVVSITAVALSGAVRSEGSEPEAVPTAVPTITMKSEPPATEDSSPSPGPEDPAAGTDSPESSEPSEEPAQGPVVGAGPTPGATTPEFTAGNGPQSVEEQEWEPAASGFAAAWANPAGGKDAWLKRIKPFVTDELLTSLEFTDVRQIPEDKLESVSSIGTYPGSIAFNAYYKDGGNRFDGLAELQHDGSWLVGSVAPPQK